MGLTDGEERVLCAAVRRGDVAAELAILAAFSKLVKKLSRKYARPPVFGEGDAESEAMIGVLAAARSFDPERNLRLSTLVYTCAERRIWKAIQEQGLPVRFPAYVFHKLRRLESAEEDLEARFGRLPGNEEIVVETGFTIETVNNLRSYPYVTISLDATFNSNPGVTDPDPIVDFLASPGPTPLEEVLRQENLDFIDTALALLKPAEEEIVRRRFGLVPYDYPASRAVIGRAMRMSTQSVFNKEHQALRKLRFILSGI